MVWKRNPSHCGDVGQQKDEIKNKTKIKNKKKNKNKTKIRKKKYDNDEQIKNVLIKYRGTIYCKIDIYFLKFVIYFSCN